MVECSEMRALASELARVRAMAQQLEAIVGQGSPAARDLCRALASSVDRSISLAGSPPSPSAAGSPRGDAGLGNAGSKKGEFKKLKGMAAVRSQVRVASVQDTAPLDDGFSWRKYGQKDILGAKYPRSYYRCTHRNTQGCHATKQVQRADGDPLLFDVVYHGAHACAQGARLNGGAPSLVGAEQHQQEQSSPPAEETEEFQWPEPMTPFSFPSSPARPAGGFFPFAPAANSQWQRPQSSYGLEADMDFDMQFHQLYLSPEYAYPEQICGDPYNTTL